MESINKAKKVERKIKKLQHVVFKETGVLCNLKPTKVINSINIYSTF